MNTTIRAETGDTTPSFWADHAIVLDRAAAGTVLHDFSAQHRGTFAGMVRFVSRLTPAERAGLVIEKAGDRVYGADEIMALAARADFPG